jgi:hypothetical protein
MNMGNNELLCVNKELPSFDVHEGNYCVMQMFVEWQCVYK